MPRKNEESKKDGYKKAFEVIDIEIQNMEKDNPPVLKEAGGSISNLPVKTTEFQEWLKRNRERNPFIGVGAVAAPEFETESDVSDKIEILDASETKDILDEELAESTFDPANLDNIADTTLEDQTEIDFSDLESLTDDCSDLDTIDFAIIQNTSKLMLGKPNDEIKQAAKRAMRDHHRKEDYTPQIDVDMAIEKAKFLLLQNPEKRKFLGYDKNKKIDKKDEENIENQE